MADKDSNASSANNSSNSAQPSAITAIQQEQERLRKAAEAKIVAHGHNGTDRLKDSDSLPEAMRLPFGTQQGTAIIYELLPKKDADSKSVEAHWKIELHGLTRTGGPLGLNIVGDVVVGRGADGAPDDPDLDLEPYGAYQMGVSRRHAMLRPTKNCLYVIDLNSTNGTMYNALRIGSGITRAIAHNDTITLGQLTFTVKIVERPAPLQTVPLSPEVVQPAAPDPNRTKPLNPKEIWPLSSPLALPSAAAAPSAGSDTAPLDEKPIEPPKPDEKEIKAAQAVSAS